MSEIVNFEVLSSATNAIVARHPGRNYPGILLQGDTVRTLLDEVDELVKEAGAGDLEAVTGIAAFLHERLVELLTHYEDALTREGIEIPYASHVSSAR
jgi:hypothetical protein